MVHVSLWDPRDYIDLRRHPIDCVHHHIPAHRLSPFLDPVGVHHHQHITKSHVHLHPVRDDEFFTSTWSNHAHLALIVSPFVATIVFFVALTHI